MYMYMYVGGKEGKGREERKGEGTQEKKRKGEERKVGEEGEGEVRGGGRSERDMNRRSEGEEAMDRRKIRGGRKEKKHRIANNYGEQKTWMK